MINSLFIGLALLACHDNTCTCIGVSAEENMRMSDAIFTARVLKIETALVVPEYARDSSMVWYHTKGISENRLVTLEKKTTYKGRNLADTIQVITGNGGGDCGYYFQTGVTYLIYGHTTKYSFPDWLHMRPDSGYNVYSRNIVSTGICDRTTASIDDELNVLKKVLIDTVDVWSVKTNGRVLATSNQTTIVNSGRPMQVDISSLKESDSLQLCYWTDSGREFFGWHCILKGASGTVVATRKHAADPEGLWSTKRENYISLPVKMLRELMQKNNSKSIAVEFNFDHEPGYNVYKNKPVCLIRDRK